MRVILTGKSGTKNMPQRSTFFTIAVNQVNHLASNY
jgi:hypothetical protein